MKVSEFKVRMWEKSGDLTAVRGLDGWGVYYDPDEVDRLAEKYPPGARPTKSAKLASVGGKNAQRVFMLLRDGRTFHEIVIETGLEPWIVRNIELEFKLGGLEGAERAKARARAAADERRRQQDHEREVRLEEREQMKVSAKEELARKLLRAGLPPETVAQAVATPAPILPTIEVIGKRRNS